MLAVAARFIYEMCQLKIKIAFLKRKPFGGCLKYPDDFIVLKPVNKVCGLLDPCLD